MTPDSTPVDSGEPVTARSRAAEINKAAQAAPSVVRKKTGGAGPWYKVPNSTAFTSNPALAEKDADGNPVQSPKLKAAKTAPFVPSADNEKSWQTEKDNYQFPKSNSSDYPEVDYEADDGESGEAFDNSYEEWDAKIAQNSELHKAVMSYTGSQYKAVNSALRSGKSEDKEAAQVIDELDKLMKVRPNPKPMTVFRTYDSALMKELKAGDEYTDKSFVSTTTDRDAYEQLTTQLDVPGGISGAGTVEIRVPAGTPSYLLTKLPFYKNGVKQQYSTNEYEEKEFLLGRDLKFRVMAKSDSANHVIVEIVP